jgi:hypothetical protein
MNHCGDLEHLVRLNSYQVTQAQDGMPIVSRILAATQNDQFCVALLEKAKGQSLHELYTILETTQPGTEILNFVAYDFGRKMGAMHFGSAISGDPEPLGFRASLHMDAHGGNVIYDLFTRELTLINNMHLNNYSYREWMSIDLFKNNYLSLRITHSLLEGLKTYRLSKHLYGQDHERFINQSFEYFNYFAIGYLESFPRELQLQIQPKFMEFCNLDAFRAQLARYPGWFEFLTEWADQKFEAREKCMRGDFLPTPSFDTDQFEQDSIRKIEAYLKTQKHTNVQPSFWKIWDLLKKASEIRTIM